MIDILNDTGMVGLIILIATLTVYLALRRLGHLLIDYWFERWNKREREREWSRRYGNGPHGD